MGQDGHEAADTKAADTTIAGTPTKQSQDSNPPLQPPANIIVLQSQKRRQQLNAETEKLHQNVRKLIEAYHRLVRQK